MKTETTRTFNDTPFSQHLYMAIELSDGKWQLGFTIGFGQQPRLRSLTGRDLVALAEEIRLAKARTTEVDGLQYGRNARQCDDRQHNRSHPVCRARLLVKCTSMPQKQK